MAQTGHIFEFDKRSAHDGALRCALCADMRPCAAHGWCPAAECLVCDECCDALLDGDPQRLIAIAANAGRIVTPDALFHACSSCERVSRRLAEEAFAIGTDSDGDGPTLC
jgi:hypothetical protein